MLARCVRNTLLITGLVSTALHGCTRHETPVDSGGPDARAKRPNIVLILADDLGYSDLGIYGGEIRTPNLNALAASGIQLTNFHVSPTCSPTRAMLLSGTDNHLAGFGTMNGLESPEQKGQPGYETFLNHDVVTFVRLLRDAGYHTYMAGKWHMGYTPDVYPPNRGFEESFWLQQGGASHFGDGVGIVSSDPAAVYYEGMTMLKQLPADFYSSNYYTDKLIEYIDKHREDGKPFFAYAAYTAPHWPLHAPEATRAQYEGVYDAGYDDIHEKRVARMRELGLLGADVEPAPTHPVWRDWDDLSEEQKILESRRMEIYATMVEILDENIGRLLSHLDAIGELENTFVLFFSDNGAEGNDPLDLANNREWVPATFDNSLDNLGAAGSFATVGPGWAHVSSIPFGLYKGFPSEGGLVVPAIASFPGEIAEGRQSNTFASVVDIAPTLLGLAGVEHPGTSYRGRDVHPLEGKSMLALLTGEAEAVHEPEFVMGWELFNRRAMRKGNWKILWANSPWGKDDWALYDLAADPAEQNDLSAEHPEKLAELIALWDQYVEDHGIIVLEELDMRFTNSTSYYDQL